MLSKIVPLKIQKKGGKHEIKPLENAVKVGECLR